MSAERAPAQVNCQQTDLERAQASPIALAFPAEAPQCYPDLAIAPAVSVIGLELAIVPASYRQSGATTCRIGYQLVTMSRTACKIATTIGTTISETTTIATTIGTMAAGRGTAARGGITCGRTTRL